MRKLVLILVLLSCPQVSFGKDPILQFDGRWEVVESIVHGTNHTTVDANRKPVTTYLIQGKEHKVYHNAELWAELEVEYDLNAKPVRFEAKFIRGTDKARQVYFGSKQGIVKFEGDEMIRTFWDDGFKRPPEFRSTADNRSTMLRLRKVAEKSK